MWASFIGALLSLFSTSYGTAMEQYIVSRNPQSTYDVEQYQREYDELLRNERFL